jgi:hypothetical protein
MKPTEWQGSSTYECESVVVLLLMVARSGASGACGWLLRTWLWNMLLPLPTINLHDLL